MENFDCLVLTRNKHANVSSVVSMAFGSVDCDAGTTSTNTIEFIKLQVERTALHGGKDAAFSLI